MEDTVLLPALRQASDPRARAQAEAESARAVDLKRHLHEAGHHWTTPETLRRAPEAFIEACRSLLGAMRQHVEREEQGLFPLVD